MSAQVAPIRAPRLTSNRLADLETAGDVLVEEISYLEEASQSKHLPDHLRARFAEKAAALRRAQEWLAGKIAAERAHRGDA